MFKSKRSSLNSVNGVYDGSSVSFEGSYHSILRNAKGKKKKKKKKNVDRSVTWSNEFQTYEERCPQSFDDYEDDDYSYNRDTFDEDDDDDDTLEHAEQKPPSGLSSIFTPITLPANFKMTSSRSEDDASLIETMDNYFDGGLSKAASDDGSIVSYERIHDFKNEIDVDHGHLGLVMPSLGGFLSVLGVNHTPDDVTDVTSISASSSSVSASSNFSERSEVVEERKAKSSRSSRRTNADTTTKSKEAAPKEKKATDTRSTPTEKKVKKKKAKSTAELNIAIQQLLTKSSESSDSANEVISTQDVSVKPSCSDDLDLIEPLEASKSGNKSVEAIKSDVETSKKKKKKLFGIKNKRQSADKAEVDKNRPRVESTKTSITPKASPKPAVPEKKVESLVENAMAQPQVKSQPVQSPVVQRTVAKSPVAQSPVSPRPVSQSPVVKSVAAVAAEIKNSFSGSTDGSSVSSDRKGKEKNKKKISLKNKLSFRRKKSTNFSGRELAFAYAQQQLAPLEDISEQHDEFRRESSDEVDGVVEEEQEDMSTKWTESIVQEPALNTTATNVKTQDERKNKSNVTRKKAGAPAVEKKKPAPLKLVEDPTANRVTKEVNKPSEAKMTEVQVTANQPTIKKKEKEMAPLKKKEQPRSPRVTADVKNPQQIDIVDPPEITRTEPASVKKQEMSPKRVKEPKQEFPLDLPKENMRDQLYDMILNAESFDSVSTTEDILDELQQIEDAAQKMYESMISGRGLPVP